MVSPIGPAASPRCNVASRVPFASAALQYHRAMRILALAVLAACSSASYQTVTMVNRSPRAIESIYVYPAGATNQGASRGSLAPGATLGVKVKEGNVEVRAVSATETLDSGLRETKQATQTLELRAPTELIFHDSTQPIVDRPGTVGVVFRVMP